MSSSIPVPHPSTKNKHDKAQTKMPTNEKEFKLMNRINDVTKKIQHINESMALRRQFLQNQKYKNMESKASRLDQILRTHRVDHLRDGQYRRPTYPELYNMGVGKQQLEREAGGMQPIIGVQVRFNFIKLVTIKYTWHQC